MRLIEAAGGSRIEARGYTLTFPADRPFAELREAGGARWADLALVAALDTAQGLDDTAATQRPILSVDGGRWRAELPAISSRWTRKTVLLWGDDDSLGLAVRVEGEGDITTVRLLGGSYSGEPRRGTGELMSGRDFATVFSPEPADPARVCRPASEPAQLDIYGGGGNPGRGHWFFTPPPMCFAFSRNDAPAELAGAPDGRWLAVALLAPVADQTFTAFRYEPAERAFALTLAYDGQTHVRGTFQTPAVTFRFVDDPYEGIARNAEDSRAAGFAPPAQAAGRPDWWHEPMFCGWGAQSRLAAKLGTSVQTQSSEANYALWLGRLADHELVPGAIVVDDRWQATYGECEPDLERWPDLPGWIAARHRSGQRVLLWWKAWDPDGLPDTWCIRNAAGLPVAVDPTNPAYELHLRLVVRRMLADPPYGYGADGLKIDFTGLAPAGPGLLRHGTTWGVAMLHRLLGIVADGARGAKPDALLVTHAPHPGFADVTSMLRLNDMARLDEPDDPAAIVPQMLHRARVARAANPDIPIDTDDWCAPDLPTWRAYLDRKLEIGVPALYYVSGLERPDDELEECDFEALRRVWAEARAGRMTAAGAMR